jgi:hypothetical protein
MIIHLAIQKSAIPEFSLTKLESAYNVLSDINMGLTGSEIGEGVLAS